MPALTDVSPHLPRLHTGLCPACAATRLHIRSTSVVRYDVAFDFDQGAFTVLGEVTEDADWDGGSEASCPACGWHGPLELCHPAAGR